MAAAYGLPQAPSNNKMLELKVIARKIKVNKAEGKVITPASFGLPAVFDVSNGADSFQLRYSTGPGRIQAGGVKKYSPDLIQMKGLTIGFGASDYDKFVFLGLHPSCETSPFVGRDPQYAVFDAEKEAAIAAQKAEREAMMLNEIWTQTSDAKVRLKAAGMTVKGSGIAATQNIPTPTIRKALSDMFHRYPNEFMVAWNSDATILNGLLVDARDRTVIEHVANTGAGRSAWVWKQGEWAGQVAVYTSREDDYFKTLRNWASLPDKYDIVLEYLTRQLSPEVAQELFGLESGMDVRATKAPKEKTETHDVVQNAVNSGIIAFVLSEKAVRWLNAEGEPDGKPIVEGVAPKTWFDETVKKFNSGPYFKAEAKKRAEALDAEPVEA